MIQKTKIGVLGGGGRTGKFLVNQLIDQGYDLKLLLRNPESLEISHSSIEIIQGDALQTDSIAALAEGCQAIISTLGQRKDEPLVGNQATEHVLRAMTQYNVNRYIVVAGLNLDTPSDKKGSETKMATEWMKANFPDIHADRQKAYATLVTSSHNWTVVRVPLIEFTQPEISEIKVSLTDCPAPKINAASLAAFLIKQLTDNQFVHQAPFIANG